MQWLRGNVRPTHIALVVLSLITILVIVLAAQRLYGPPPESTSRYVAQASMPSVAFVGDSFTSGTRDGGQGRANYTSLLAEREGWRVTNAAVDGAGYVAAPPGGGPFAAQVSRVVAARPSVVAVVGGRSDSTTAPDAVRAAADGLYRDLRTQLPQARIVVVGPIWSGADAPVEALAARDAVRAAAETARLPFLDPIAERWFLAPDDPGLTPDRQRLNDRGHQAMVDLVGGVLRGSVAQAG